MRRIRIFSIIVAIAAIATIAFAYFDDGNNIRSSRLSSSPGSSVQTNASSFAEAMPGSLPNNTAAQTAKETDTADDIKQSVSTADGGSEQETGILDAIADIKDFLYQSGDKKVTDLDSKVVSYLEDDSIKSNKKADRLWELILEVGLNSPAASYFLDALEVLRPLHLSDKLMSAFNSNTDDKIKRQIMQVLAHSTFVDEGSTHSAEELEYIVSQSEKIRDFVKNNMSNPANETEFRQALDAHMLISRSDEVAATAARMLAGDYQNYLSPRDVVNYVTQTKFSSDSGKNIPMSNLLEAAKALPSSENQEFNQTFFQYIKDDAASGLADTDKLQLLEYLEQQEPRVALSDDNPPDAIALGKYYNWFEALTVAQTTAPEEKFAAMREKLMQTQDNNKAAIILLFADEQLKNDLNEQQLQDLSGRLDGSLLNPKISESERALIKDALAYLRE